VLAQGAQLPSVSSDVTCHLFSLFLFLRVNRVTCNMFVCMCALPLESRILRVSLSFVFWSGKSAAIVLMGGTTFEL